MAKDFKPTFTITNRINAGLTRIERARAFIGAATHSMTRQMMHREDSVPYGGLPAGRQGEKP